jgi:heterodisulfide reductase subunit A-like polyferredoxin
MGQKSCVIFCRCGANIISEDKFKSLSDGLNNLDIHVYELHDLCAFSISGHDVLKRIGTEFDHKIILACYPRAVENMLKQAGLDLGSMDILNFRELTPEDIFLQLHTRYQIAEGKACYQEQVTDLDVPAWFPVIDESRCTLCGKCARFCLFGVYTFDKKSLKVINPLACKNNCPACGRTCPASAIMFPRLEENIALAGAVPAEGKRAVQGGGLYVMLNDRNRDRKQIFRQGVIQQAEEERRVALEELKAAMIKRKGNA